jgi:hypothetical protein
MEGDAIENGSQGHAFGTSFTGVGEKKYVVCAVWEVFASGRNPSHAYVFPFPGTDFCLGIKNSSCGHTTPGLLGKDFGRDFSGFERDDLDEHVCFWSFFLLGLVFHSSVANTLICTRWSATFLKPHFGLAIYARSLSSSRARCLFFSPTVTLSGTP